MEISSMATTTSAAAGNSAAAAFSKIHPLAFHKKFWADEVCLRALLPLVTHDTSDFVY